MKWSSIIGQNRVKLLLRKIIKSNRIPHAMLFYGPEGVGKDALAIEFAKTLLCENNNEEACENCANCRRFESLNHPNLNLVIALPTGRNEKKGDDPLEVLRESQISEIRAQIALKSKNTYHKIEINKANFIKINSVRDIKREASLSQSEVGKKIFLILGAETMNAESSNSLLKTLEEPLQNTIIILTTASKEQLLPTIVSRCQLIQCDLLTESEIASALVKRDHINEQIAMFIAQIANGSYNTAQKLCKIDIIEERDDIIKFIENVLKRTKYGLITKIEELSILDKYTIESWLRLLQSWLREALLLQQNAKQPLLDDNENKMRRLVNKFTDANFVESIESVEKAIVHVNKNIYLPLVFTKLSFDLKKSILGKPIE